MSSQLLWNLGACINNDLLHFLIRKEKKNVSIIKNYNVLVSLLKIGFTVFKNYLKIKCIFHELLQFVLTWSYVCCKLYLKFCHANWQKHAFFPYSTCILLQTDTVLTPLDIPFHQHFSHSNLGCTPQLGCWWWLKFCTWETAIKKRRLISYSDYTTNSSIWSAKTLPKSKNQNYCRFFRLPHKFPFSNHLSQDTAKQIITL